jgi:hypothetical protein
MDRLTSQKSTRLGIAAHPADAGSNAATTGEAPAT